MRSIGFLQFELVLNLENLVEVQWPVEGFVFVQHKGGENVMMKKRDYERLRGKTKR